MGLEKREGSGSGTGPYRQGKSILSTPFSMTSLSMDQPHLQNWGSVQWRQTNEAPPLDCEFCRAYFRHHTANQKTFFKQLWWWRNRQLPHFNIVHSSTLLTFICHKSDKQENSGNISASRISSQYKCPVESPSLMYLSPSPPADIWHIVGFVPAQQARKLWSQTHQGTNALRLFKIFFIWHITGKVWFV